MRRTQFAVAMALATLAMATAPAVRAEWQPLVQEAGKRVDFDASRPAEGDSGHPSVWSRLTLASPAVDALTGRSFRSVDMLSRFDCQERQVSTLQRIYRDENGLMLRDERLEAPTKSAVTGLATERLFATACKSVLAQGGVKARPARADYRAGQGGQMLLAADEHAAPKVAEKPAEKSAEKAPEKVTEPKVLNPEKIQLPIRKPINPEAMPGQVKRMPVNPEHIPTPKKKIEASEHDETPLAHKKAKKAVAAAKPVEAPHAAHQHWSYEGETGPANWAKLNPAYATCDIGTRQSPIDIRGGVKVDLPPIKFEYQPSLFNILDNGHTIQVNYGEGSGLTVQGRRYDLVQFHFHKPSEERINGRSYDMVAHLVHKDEDGRLAVVAVLFERGADNPFIQTLWNNLPLEQNSEVSPETPIDLNTLLPKDRSYYTYMGSLTTPPCTEGVTWMVLKSPVQMSTEQMAVFSHLYNRNVRPIQRATGRLIKESR
ncbi:MAG: carbonic anhydrase family protein [Rhodocyclaceae bacterium]|nr:carbonic anhydrase family protein [Rhodocyclaceae bacterium]